MVGGDFTSKLLYSIIQTRAFSSSPAAQPRNKDREGREVAVKSLDEGAATRVVKAFGSAAGWFVVRM